PRKLFKFSLVLGMSRTEFLITVRIFNSEVPKPANKNHFLSNFNFVKCFLFDKPHPSKIFYGFLMAIKNAIASVLGVLRCGTLKVL
ncbi:MAG: hypothetical protein AABW90_00505, partial [Nanoarchaeota archaeon]